MPEHFDRIEAGYDDRDFRELNTTGKFSDCLREKVVEKILRDCAGVFNQHWPYSTGMEVVDTWVSWFSTVMHFFVLTKILDGRTPSSPRILYNHLADINMSAFATYYEGILTADNFRNRVLVHSRDFIDQINASRK